MPFDPFKPADSVLEGLSSSTAKALKYISAHPNQVLGGVAAAMVAPLLISNDERGYVKSAAITTPLVAAGTLAAPQLFEAARNMSQRVANYSRRGKAHIPTWEDLTSMKSKFSKGAMFRTQYTSATKDYFAGAGGFPKEGNRTPFNNVRRRFKKLYNAENHALLANAVFSENYRVMSARELSAFGHAPVANMSWRDMWRVIASRRDNPDFLSGMNFRLQEMTQIHDPGGTWTLEQLRRLGRRDEWGLVSPTTRRSAIFGQSPLFENMLKRDRPELFHELQAAFAAGKFYDTDQVRLLGVGRGSEIEKIAGIEISRSGFKPLTIYVPQADRSIIMGSEFNRLGVSRQVLNMETNELLPADIFGIRNAGGDLGRLRETMNKAQFGGYIDAAEDSFSSLAEADHFSYQLDPSTIYARSEQVLFHGLDNQEVFKNVKDREEAILKAMRDHDLIKTWSENSLAKGVVETQALSEVSLGGVYDPQKQSRQLRSLKPIRAVDPIEGIKFSGFHAPFSRTTALESRGLGLAEFGSHLGGVSADLKSLVGDLPNKKKFLFDIGTREMAVKHIMADTGKTEAEALKIWAQMRNFLREGNNLSRIKKLGYLGEGDHLVLGGNLPNTLTEKIFYVTEPRLKDLTPGTRIPKNTLLGFFNGATITTQSEDNILRDFSVLEDGRVALRVDQIGRPGIAKIDTHTKGLALGTHKGEAASIRNFLNMYGEAAGTGAYYGSDVEMLAVTHYSHNKANVGEQTVNLGASLMERLEKSGELAQVAEYKTQLEGLGFSRDGRTLVEDVGAFRNLSYEARQARLQQAMDVINGMFEHVGARIRESQIRGDEFLQHYAFSQDKLIDYMHKYASPVNATMWNSMDQNVPQKATITYDMFGQLYTRGYHGAIKELRENSVIDANVLMTHDLMKYLDAGDFSSPLGPGMTVDQAIPGFSGRVDLSDSGRTGTVFDPGHTGAASNYSIQLNDGSYVPVLGHEAYGGKINRYGAGELAANKRESLLSALLSANHSGNAAAIETAKSAYFGELRKFGQGKEGFLRAQRTSTNGLAGFIQTAPAQIPHFTPAENPFEVAIGSDMFKKIRNKDIRTALERGEDVFAGIARHPVSHMPLVRVRLDRRLNPNAIGVDEGARGLLMADDDGDIANLLFFNRGSDAHIEAQRAVMDVNSLQHQELRVQRALEGIEDDSRIARDTFYKSISEAKLGNAKSVEEITRARLAGASVGQYSNILTDLMLGLETNNRVTDAGERAVLQRVFWSLRQAPIAAQKSKAEGVRGLEDALKMAFSTSKGLRAKSEGGFNVFYRSLSDIGHAFGKTMPYNRDMEVLGLSADMAINGMINPLMKYIENNRSTFERYYHGRREGTSELADYLTMTEEGIRKRAKAGGKILVDLENVVPYLRESGGPTRGGAKQAVAEALGAMNEGIAGAASDVRRVVNGPSGKALAIGLGVAAAAGILTTSMRAHTPPEFSARNSNAYRPENTAGAQDHVAGEAIPGSMAPTNPPRRLVPGRAGVRTALIAPVRQAVDLEVRGKSPDRARATEQAKIMSRMSTDGDSNVTVNVRQGLRRRSLRMREKMREMRDK